MSYLSSHNVNMHINMKQWLELCEPQFHDQSDKNLTTDSLATVIDYFHQPNRKFKMFLVILEEISPLGFIKLISKSS